MNRHAFEQIYIDYKEKDYHFDTTESVHRCYQSYDQKQKRKIRSDLKSKK